MNKYLQVAKEVLEHFGFPLYSYDITRYALENNLLKTEGITPWHTMRARLSEHIKNYGDNAAFKRVGANKFALKSWDNVNTYISKPFTKNNREIVVCLKQSSINRTRRFFGLNKNFQPYFDLLKNEDNIVVCYREEADSRKDIKQLISYVVLKDYKGRILTYRRGMYSKLEDFLKNVLCIGFGGHVIYNDTIPLFQKIEDGIINSAKREIFEELKGIIPSNLEFVAVINDDSSNIGLRHFAFILKADLPKNFKLEKAISELSINKLEFMREDQIWEKYYEMEFWSQLICKNFYSESWNYKPVYLTSKLNRVKKGPILITGEIGCGKTEVVNFLYKKYFLPKVSTRKCISKLIGVKDFGKRERKNFQDKAQKFISTNTGISKFANLIKEEILLHENDTIIVDGIRQIETYKKLKEYFPDLILIYIEAPRDTAYKLFKKRESSKTDIDTFREAREHEVEKEVRLLKSRADVYLYNGGTLKELLKIVNNWWSNIEKI